MTDPTEIVVARDHILDAPMPIGTAAASSRSLSDAIKFRWKSAFIIAVVLSAASVGTIWHFVEPKYVVVSQLEIDPVVQPILRRDASADISRHYNIYVATQRGTILSPDLIAEALESPKVREVPPLQGKGDQVSLVLSKLTVRRIPGTELLRLGMIGQQPETLAAIVNSIAQAYLRRHEDEKRELDELVLQSLRDERASLDAQRKAKATEIQTLQAEGSNGAEPNFDAAITIYHENLIAVQRKHSVAEMKLNVIKSGAEKDGATELTLGNIEAYKAQDPQLNAMKTQLRSVKMEPFQDEAVGRGKSHPDVKSRPQRISALEDGIAQREKEIREEYLRDEISRLQSDILEAEIEEEMIQLALAKVYSRNMGSSRQDHVIADIGHEREFVERALEQVRNKIWSVRVEQKRMSRVKLKSPARAPSNPNLDKRPKFSVVACIACFFLSGAFTFIRHRVDSRIRTPVEVSQGLGVRILGSVHHVQEANGSPLSLEHGLREPVRGISTVLLSLSEERKSRSRLITSPTPGSGKSSLAVNLARSIGATGRKVLLVDGDNHRQGVSRVLQMSDGPGLREFLLGECPADLVIHALPSEPFRLLAAGSADDCFSDIVANQNAQKRLRDLFLEYDEIIVDSPPVLANSHAVILATLVDEVVLVLRAGRSSREEAEASKQCLASVGCHAVGAILNGVDPKQVKYGYGYGYSYGYAGSDQNSQG